jgi:hypothetical protein
MFKVGKKVVVGDYHNIYIRLRKKFDSGQRMHYFIVLGGHRVDKYVLSQVSKDLFVQEMRGLGIKLAENLDLNYFDEANSSPFHVVRHHRPKKGKQEVKRGTSGTKIVDDEFVSKGKSTTKEEESPDMSLLDGAAV